MRHTFQEKIRRLSSGVVLILILISLVGGVMMYRLLGDVGNEAVSGTQVFIGLDTEDNDAEIAFHRQIQEWHDLLLRGGDPELFQKYYRAFHARHEEVQNHLKLLADKMGQYGLSTLQVNQIQQAHLALLVRYELALNQFPLSKKTDNYLRVDLLMRGLDRKLYDDLEALRYSIHAQILEMIGTVSDKVQGRHVGRSLFVMAIMMLLFPVVSLIGFAAIVRMTRRVQEERERFRVTLNSIGDAVIVTDMAGAVDYLNPVGEAMTGWTLDEARGKPLREIFDIVHEDTREAADNPVEIVLREGHVVGLDSCIVLLSRSGEEYAIEDSAAPLRDENGKLSGVVLVFHDDTLQRQAQQRLQESEERLRMTLQCAPDAVIICEQDGRIVYVNDNVVSLLGYGRDEFTGMTVFDLVAAEWREAYRQCAEQILADNEHHVFEIRWVRKDGGKIPMELNAVLLPNGRVYGSCRDISERKQAEIALRHSNRALATKSAVNRNLVHAMTEEELLRAICQTIVEQCGYRLAWVGYLEQDAAKSIRPVAQYGFEEGYLETAGVVWADTERGRGPVGKAARGGKSQTAQNILTDESMLPWRAEAVKRGYASGIALPLAQQGKVFGVLCIYAEHTDAYGQKETALLEEMANDLVFGVESLRARHERDVFMGHLSNAADELVKANTQLEEERAMLAQRVLERTTQLLLANKAKDSFLATMSHEIRTPLGGLLGMMELLGLSSLNNEQNEMLHVAQNSGKSLLRIVDDILDWSKIEAGKLELAPCVASIAEMIKGVTGTYAQLASVKGITLRQQIDDNLSAAHLFDPLRVSQILNNFTSNAIKFTAHGSVEIGAERAGRQDGNEIVRFSVKDSGVGIAPEHRSRLFQHYEQASNDTARMYGGTGLGLAICRSLAELMDGTLSVESIQGIGSTFFFTVSLPVANLAAQRDLQLSLDKQERHEDGPDITPLVDEGQHLSVLVVDDHPVNRMLLKQQLEQLGLHVVTAESGIVGLSVWWTGHFDLIITDCHMPGMDGYEFARSIREIEQHEARPQRVPVIAWTANVLDEEEGRCRVAGMDDLLTKPTELSNLRMMLLKWMHKSAIPAIVAPRPELAEPAAQYPPVVGDAIDFAVLKKFALSRAAQVEMLQEFNVHNRSDIANLNAVLKDGDPAAVARSAHRIKGACRMVGALELEGICARIEQAARQGDMQGARAVADHTLGAAVMRIEVAIGRFIAV